MRMVPMRLSYNEATVCNTWSLSTNEAAVSITWFEITLHGSSTQEREKGTVLNREIRVTTEDGVGC